MLCTAPPAMQQFSASKTTKPLVAVSDGESDDESITEQNMHPQINVCCTETPVGFPGAILCMKSPRMTSSLDNVDLWDESDSDSEVGHSKTYDVINGVQINPRNTIDLADLRCPVACKRNRLEMQGKGHNSNVDISKPMHRQLRQLRTMQNSPRSLPNLHQAPSLKELSKKSPKNTPEPPVLDGKAMRNASIQSGSNSSSDSQSRLPQRSMKPPSSIPKPLNATQKPLHTPPKPVDISTKPLLATVSFTNTPPNTEKLLSSSPNARKVKFSNMVSVQEGEFTTLDLLRRSNNSAQIYKGRYLSPGGKNNSTSHRHGNSSREGSPNSDQSSRGLLVC